MIFRKRSWSINVTKDSLITELDYEIQKEYQILNKFSSEKFSIILIIFAFITVLITIFDFFPQIFSESQDILLLYLFSADLMILIWSYWGFLKKISLKIFKIRPLISGPVSSLNFFVLFDKNERARFKFLLNADWQYAKKGEPHSWAIFIFLFTLIGISYANLQNWINIPHLNDPIFFGIPLSIALIIFSLIMIISIYYLNIKGIIWDILFSSIDFFEEKSQTKMKTLLIGLLFIISGFIIVMLPIFYYVFPLVFFAYFIIPNLSFLSYSNNFVFLLLCIIFINVMVEFLAIPYGINLVENIKNEKIWWLERLKIEILSNGSINQIQFEHFYKKIDCSDIYLPIPIQRMFIFQKYVFLPKWLLDQTNDIDLCDDSDFRILKERFEFHKNLIYRNKIQ